MVVLDAWDDAAVACHVVRYREGSLACLQGDCQDQLKVDRPRRRHQTQVGKSRWVDGVDAGILVACQEVEQAGRRNREVRACRVARSMALGPCARFPSQGAGAFLEGRGRWKEGN